MSDRFILSDSASKDIEAILSYILDESGARRVRHVANRLHEVFHELADFPGIGNRREDLTMLPVAFRTVWSYLVIYKPDTRPIEIVRVLHGARDVQALLAAD